MVLRLITNLKGLFAGKAKQVITPNRTIGARGRSSAIIEDWIARKGWMEDASLQGVADSLGVIKEDLSIYFRWKYQKNFLRWRKEMRIEEAKRLLLKDKTIPTAIIGEEVGICDKSNFKRQFREVTGETPAQWRSKHKVHISRH